MSNSSDQKPPRIRILSPRLVDREQAGDFQLKVEPRTTQSAEERAEIQEIIRQGIEDIKAGRHRPADEVTADLRRKYGL